MTTHTPGPWRIGDAGRTVFGPKTDNPSPETVASGLSRANAAYIVKAVNNHAQLLEALQYILATITEPHENDVVQRDRIYKTFVPQARAAIEAAS